MIQVHCATAQQIDAIWRMLGYVPDAEFEPVEICLGGKPHYTVVRTDGEQTTVQPGDPQACTNRAA